MPSPRSHLFARALLVLLAAGSSIGATESPGSPHVAPRAAAQPPAPNQQPPSVPVEAGSQPPAAPAPTPAPAGAVLAAPMSGNEIIDMLDKTVDWYRMLATEQQFSTEPSDLLILYENRQLGGQVTGLAFDVARAGAKLIPKDASAASQGDSTAAASAQTLAQLQAKIDAQAASVQSEIDAARQKLGASSRKAKQQLQAKIAELQGEIDLLNTKKSIVTSIAGAMNGNGAGGSAASALRAQIDAMATALPASQESPAPGAAAATPNAASAAHAPPAASNGLAAAAASSAEGSRFGIWDVAANLFKLSEKMSGIQTVDRSTAALQDAYAHIRANVVAQMRALSSRGDSLMAQADAADSATLDGLRSQLDSISAQFKQASAILLPLSKQDTLLKQYRHNLKNWHDAVKVQSHDAFRSLGVRLGILLLVLGVVFALAQAWHRAVLKYVQDTRRRYQLLLLRKIALWSLVVVIVGFTFASELSSIVTFAGLITAGLAVAMQSVLVSIVGYFFLIGKYGIRVGDRVQIGEVNGEIIELGMVRMYLMEFAGQSASPTGRVAAFPNSVVFQVSAGLFKQIPGVAFAWHDITLNVPAGADYSQVKEKLFAAANEALADYHEEIQRQTRELKRTTMSSAGGEALPTVQLSYSAKGVDAHVRYPVHLPHAAEIDERMSKALLQVISGLNLKGGAPGAPPAP